MSGSCTATWRSWTHAARRCIPSFFAYSGFNEVPRGRILGTLLRMNVVTTSSIMVRASLRERFLPVPDELFFPDWHVATRVAEVAGVEIVDGTTAYYRSHASNMGLGGTGSKFYADMRHNVRITRWHLRTLDLSSVRGARDRARRADDARRAPPGLRPSSAAGPATSCP